MKNRKYITLAVLLLLLCVKSIYGQTITANINEFLQWKLKATQPIENKIVQENLPIERISSKVVPLQMLSKQLVKRYKLDSLLSDADIDTMNKQIKYWSNRKGWDTKNHKLSFINPDTLSNAETPFLELSIPIFSMNKQLCLLQSNINCHQNYCHDELLAIYLRQNATEWKIIQVLYHITF